MATAPAPNPQAAQNHIFHCRQYMGNALEALNKDEPGKAGELLWGSVSQAIHAVDAWRGAVIDDHRSLMNFAYHRIGREIDDQDFPTRVEAASSLHHNFYVPTRTRADLELLVPGIQRAISQVLELLPEEARDGASTG